MKLKTRIAAITTGTLAICCVFLCLWNMLSTSAMMNNIRLLEKSQGTMEEVRYTKLQAFDQQENRNQARLLLGLAAVVVFGGVLSYFAADLAMKPIRNLTQTIQNFRTSDLKSELPLPKTKDESYALIRAFNEMIHRLNHSFDREKRISANIAHAFKTPLAVLLTKYEVLEMKHPQTLEDYKKAVASSKEKVEYLAKITADLLALYRQTNAVINQIFDLMDLFHQIETDCNPLAVKKRVTLVLDCTPLNIVADRLLFGQMLYNLVENAIKYTCPGGQVWVASHAKDDILTISVRDTGMGISDEQKPFVFEPFYRAIPSASTVHTGSGLGLTFVKEIVQLYRGDIRLEDAIPTGSLFTITLPGIIA